MRTVAELQQDVRPALSGHLAWSLLMTLHAEADDAGGEPIRRSVFQLGSLADISPFRVAGLLHALSGSGAINFAPAGEKTYAIVVL